MSWPVFPYGGDYNPEQWSPELWTEDVRLMGEAHWNVATLPVFGWAAIEPEEGRFTFEWLDDIVARLHAGGIRICFATATASVPAWLPQKYPDVLVVGEDGIRRKHGNRHSFCPNSENYKRLSTRLTGQIANRYGTHPALLLWHVNNEYGTFCYCDRCAEAFRVWLQSRYGGLDELNRRWSTAFWGHAYSDWAQIETPTRNGEQSIQALTIDYHRFQSDALLALFKAEAEVLRRATPDVPITTNMMGTFFPLDYREWAKAVDVVSWDNYPSYNADPADVAFSHSLMRGLKDGQPFLLMEQSPSQQNWAPYNRLKHPGQLRLQSYQAVAHGADSVMYFQWRRGRGGIEKLHGAVVEHGGGPGNRVFKEVARLGAELAAVGARLQNARVPARVAVLFDWPNWWGLRYSSGPSRDLDYPKVVRSFYGALHALGIQADVVSPGADMSRFEVIVAPMLTMLGGSDAARIAERVREGASLLATSFTAFVDENDRVFENGAPGPWSELLGISVEETDALPPESPNGLVWADGFTCGANLLADRIRLQSAIPLARYTSDFYTSEPALTRNSFGAGFGYYLASFADRAGLRKVLGEICASHGVSCPMGGTPPVGVEVTERVTPTGERQIYLLQHGLKPAEVRLPSGRFRDLLSGEAYEHRATLPPREVLVLTPYEPVS